MMVGTLFIISIVVLSQAGTLIRYADAHALVICFWRLLMASVLLIPFVAKDNGFSSLGRLSKSDLKPLVISGFALFVHFYFFFTSVQQTSVANATILFSLNPLFTTIGARLMFHEPIRKNVVIALALGFLGVVTLFAETASGARQGPWQGDLWGVLCAATFSVYILTGKQVRQKLSNFPYTFAIYAQTAIYALIACLILKIPLFGYSNVTWGAFAATAIFPTLFGHAIFTYCLNHLNVTYMSCMTLIEPLLAAATAYPLFGEAFTPWAALSFALTCASVLTLYAPALRQFVMSRRTNASER